MADHNLPEILEEAAKLLSRFGRLMADLRAAHEQADNDGKRAACLVFTNLVRPAMTSFVGILEREFD